MASKFFEKYFSDEKLPDNPRRCWMTWGEICEAFRTAEDKHSQLYILSQLNGVKVANIVDILIEHGYEVPKNWKSKPVYQPGRKKVKLTPLDIENKREQKKIQQKEYNRKYYERKKRERKEASSKAVCVS